MTTPPEVAPVTRLIDQDRVSRYSVAANDPNPIHTDADFAATTDFGRPIAHGMLVLALVSEAMSATFGERWAASGALKVRWRAPAIQPVEVTATAEPRGVEDGVASYAVQCATAAGAVLLTGTASVRVEGA
ncbi:MAG: MaoC family dehydratase [Chloroflexi bacterium]|nr:MaoC family dehydratase [Chloroflexota bacterium]MYD65140.1 MaoC family dehydratase [Chloroflexota bacterium]